MYTIIPAINPKETPYITGPKKFLSINHPNNAPKIDKHNDHYPV